MICIFIKSWIVTEYTVLMMYNYWYESTVSVL